MSVLHQNSGGIGKSIPSALKISLRHRPPDISRVSGNLLGVGDGFSNTSLVLVEHGYIAVHDIIATTNNPWLEFRAIYEGNIIKLGLWCKQMRQEIV